MTTWLPVDVVSSVPYDTIFLVVQMLMGTSASEAGGGSGSLRMLKMLRLMKLVRILRASRILKRWEAHIVPPEGLEP